MKSSKVVWAIAVGVTIVSAIAVGCIYDKRISSRIVGGKDSVTGKWPWQVSLQIEEHFCGASIISHKWLISAAHCFQGDGANHLLWTAYMGSSIVGKGTSRTIRRIITHPKHGKKITHDYDIALLELSSPLKFTDFIRAVRLPSASHIFSNGQTCTVTGWGKINSNQNAFSTILQAAEIEIMDDIMCNLAYETSFTSRMLCAGFLSGGIDACQGDSGGPLVCQDSDGTWLLAGIVSFGIGCGRPNFPGVYTRVTAFRDWVLQETRV